MEDRRSKKINYLVSEVLGDKILFSKETNSSLNSSNDEEILFDYQVQDFDKEETVSLQKREDKDEIVLSIESFKERKKDLEKKETAFKNLKDDETVLDIQEIKDHEDRSEKEKNLDEEKREHTFFKVKSPTEEELSTFTQYTNRIKKSVEKVSKEKDLEILLELKNQELQNKEKLLVGYKVELDRIKDQIKFYEKINKDRENQTQEKVRALIHSLQESIQQFQDENNIEDVFKKCVGES